MLTPAAHPDPAEQCWCETAGAVERIVLDLTPGSTWRFVGFPSFRPGRWRTPPGLYRLIGVSRDVRTGQEMCVHQGIGGPDDGLLYHCPLGAWAQFFTPVVEGVEAPPARVPHVHFNPAPLESTRPVPDRSAGPDEAARKTAH